MKKAAAILVGLFAVLAMAFVVAQPASATPEFGAGPIECTGVTGWGVQGDEVWEGGTITPTEKGFVFEGPTLMHHAFPDTKLEDLPKHADLVTVDVTGVPPLVKFRTDGPYSTLNIDANGKWWSSKILPADEGGISNPVDGPEDFIDLPLTKLAGEVKPKYTDATLIKDIQVGYATDAGNEATVVSLTYAGDTFNFKCTPAQTASPSPSGSASPQPTTTASPGATASPTPSFSFLPVTGSDSDGANPAVTIALIGSIIVVLGVAGFIGARRRRTRYTA